MNIHNEVLDVLRKLQTIAPSYLSGGYLRDLLIGIPPTDVDILTECTIEEVKTLFPSLQGTERGLEFGVGRFSKNKFQFEIVSFKGNTIENVVVHKDFVMNSLLHDGNSLIDSYGAVEDIKEKKIRLLDNPYDHFKEHPQAYLRAIRFTGQLGFTLDDALIDFLKQNMDMFDNNNESRIQQEGYKIIRSKFPLLTFETLISIGFLSPIKDEYLMKRDLHQTFPPLDDQLHIRLLLISLETGIDFLHEFIDFFHMTKELKEKMHPFLPYLYNDNIPTKPYLLNKVILLKKHQYKDEPERFRWFLQSIRDKK